MQPKQATQWNGVFGEAPRDSNLADDWQISVMCSNRTILVVEDQVREREALCRVLRTDGYNALGAANTEEACGMVSDPIDLVICDVRLGQGSGLDVLKAWKVNKPGVPMIMVTAYGEVSTAVTAMKMGALDYLTKPLRPGELLMLVSRHLPEAKASGTSASLDWGANAALIGKTPAIRAVREQIEAAASTQCPVLIAGESGTGKEAVAIALHEQRFQHGRPFVALNLGAIPELLVGPELFGSEKGTVAGTGERRPGRILTADGGTLFIDGIASVPLVVQQKLLRFLETKRFSLIASEKQVTVDVRMVVAADEDLNRLSSSGKILSDLYHRLSQITIHVPPLRDRPEDIPLLIDYLVRACANRRLREPPAIEPALLKFLCSYAWPGNVRQLHNAIESMLVLEGSDVLTMGNLTAFLSGTNLDSTGRSSQDDISLAELERLAVIGALQRTMGNRTQAAERLGISVRTLQRKMKQWALEGYDVHG